MVLQRKSGVFSSKKTSQPNLSLVSKFLTGFKPSKKKVGKSSVFTSKKSSKKFSLKKAKLPKKSLLSPFLTSFKSSTKKSKSKKSSVKKSKSIFITSKKLSKNTPEISSFLASKSSPKFKTKVGKSFVFTQKKFQKKTAFLSPKKPSGFLVFDVTRPSIQSGVQFLSLSPKTGEEKAVKESQEKGLINIFAPIAPPSTDGGVDQGNFFDDIAEFFSNFFGGGGASSQDRASDTSTITSINFTPATLPSQDLPDTEVPGESFGLGLGGISEDSGNGDQDGILNSIVNDPVKLGLSIVAIIGIIAGVTGGK